MRKLWPPNYDAFSAAIWALITAVSLNVIPKMVPLSDETEWLMMPGIVGATILTGRGFEKSDTMLWPFIYYLTSIGFYFVLVWLLILLFLAMKRPVTGKRA
jgi:hypothetical protein